MALAAETLDDVTWQDFVDSARRRIVAASGGTWTLHAPVDPGVTLLELFAWLLEQRVYFLDQTAPEHVRAILRLLGTTPAEPVAAATVLAFSADGYDTVPAGSVMRVVRRKRPLEFTLDQALALVPLVGEPSAKWTSEQELTVHVTPSLPPSAQNAELGLLLELETAPDIAPAWAPDAVAALAPPTTLRFSYGTASGWQDFASVVDDTGGLRRSGVVRLPLPLDWTHDLRIRADGAAFSFRPIVVRAVLNAAVARHVRPVARAPFEASWLPLAGAAVLGLVDAREASAPPLPASLKLKLREARDGAWQTWSPVADFTLAGPGDRVVVVDRDNERLSFGDGLNGRMPVLAAGAPNVDVSYSAGGGGAGNFGPGAAFEAEPPLTFQACNVVPADGGAEAESLDDARERVAAGLRRPTRAVIASDYEELARTTPGAGIARAHAAVGVLASFRCLAVPGAVTVFVLPWAPRPDPDDELGAWAGDFVWAPAPDVGALAAVRSGLDAARLVTTELCVRGPVYRRVALRVGIEGNVRDVKALRTNVTLALRRFLDPLRGFDGNGWPFGEPVRPSALLAEVQAVLDEQADATDVRVVVDGQAPLDDCSDVAIEPYALVELRSVEVSLTRVVPERGGLR